MVGLASILVLGVASQWLAWKLKIPSILLLLLVGCLAGPLAQPLIGHRLLDPDLLFGEALQPFVSIAVGLILFEGGLTLRLRDLQGATAAIRNLIVLGAPLTWGLVTLAAHFALGWSWGMSTLVGAILIVTGPTVILPLLRTVRPSGAVGRVVRWEGIVTDPIGAIAAVLVFEAITHGTGEHGFAAPLWGILRALAAGGGVGVLGAWLLTNLLRRDLVPDFLHSPVALAFAVTGFVISNLVQHEAGLLAVTVMGVVLANQDKVTIEHIVEFKENLRVLLVASLFILLAARLPLEELQAFDLSTLAFVLLLLFVVRPTVAFVALARTELKLREKLFVAWMAPRGIVAAAVSSVFALGLVEQEVPEAGRLVPVVFAVIVGTVAVYGLTAAPFARRLGLSKAKPGGVLLLGASPFARAIAKALLEEGAEVLLVDTNYHDAITARMEGIPVWHGSILSEDFEMRAPLEGLGALLAMTPNDSVNALACLHMTPLFGRAGIFQLTPARLTAKEGDNEIPRELRGRPLFQEGLDFFDLQRRLREGDVIKRSNIGEEFSFEDFLEHYERPDKPALPLFVVDREGNARVVIAGETPEVSVGDTVIALVGPDTSATSGAHPG